MASAREIRNFCIVAHIDHGKSTLADRLLEITGTVDPRNAKNQILDDMDLERERGITIKARAVSMFWEKDGKEYLLNLIDTPGHVDFAYEVQKSLQACEGALLLVDAAQGVEAQTVANAHLADKAGLKIIPVLNKCDLPHARPEEVLLEIEEALCLPAEEAFQVSAKTGAGVEELLHALVDLVPPPGGRDDAPLQALIFDAVYDEFRGVIVYLRLAQGVLRRGGKILMRGAGTAYEVLEVGRFTPRMSPVESLGAGEVGYMIANIKRLSDVRIGDTVVDAKGERAPALPGYRPPHSMVFCGLYPVNPGDFENLRAALEKLSLNDSSFTFEPESSEALGFGFRGGFLGLLHMDIVQERLERESGLDLVQTAPTVRYLLKLRNGAEKVVQSPADVPDGSLIQEWREPVVRASLILPDDYVGPVMKLCVERRGRYVKTEYLTSRRVLLVFDLPLAEIIFDFFDKLKSITRGYGTMDYELKGYEPSDLVKLRILVGGNEVDALSVIVHRDQAPRRGRQIIKKLQKEIPRHLFQVSLQAAVGGKILARENIRPLAKNVTAKCYGGDITRKRKLLEKQKEGKRRMRQVGRVEIPQKAFLAVLGGGEED